MQLFHHPILRDLAVFALFVASGYWAVNGLSLDAATNMATDAPAPAVVGGESNQERLAVPSRIPEPSTTVESGASPAISTTENCTTTRQGSSVSIDCSGEGESQFSVQSETHSASTGSSSSQQSIDISVESSSEYSSDEE